MRLSEIRVQILQPEVRQARSVNVELIVRQIARTAARKTDIMAGAAEGGTAQKRDLRLIVAGYVEFILDIHRERDGPTFSMELFMIRLVLANPSPLKLRSRSGPPSLWHRSQLIPAVPSKAKRRWADSRRLTRAGSVCQTCPSCGNREAAGTNRAGIRRQPRSPRLSLPRALRAASDRSRVAHSWRYGM